MPISAEREEDPATENIVSDAFVFSKTQQSEAHKQDLQCEKGLKQCEKVRFYKKKQTQKAKLPKVGKLKDRSQCTGRDSRGVEAERLGNPGGGRSGDFKLGNEKGGWRQG